jgi:aminopeptidase N
MREQIATALEKLAQKARGRNVDNESKVAERNDTRAWTDEGQGSGLDYPSDISAEHSGDYDALLDDEIQEYETELQRLKAIKAERAVEAVHQTIDAHDHKWKPGMLPGAKMVRICSICGATEVV